MKKVLEEYIRNELNKYCFLRDPQAKVPYLPTNMYLEPTNACNLCCLICARRKMIRKMGFLKLADFKLVIDKLVKNNWYLPLTFSGNGEPLLNRDIFAMIKYAKKKKFNVSLISNSTLLDKEKAELLLNSGLDRYQTMFDSIDKKSYESLRCGATYETTKKNLINLIKMNEQRKHPMFISVGLVETSLTKRIKATKEFWNSFPIDNFYHSSLFSLQEDSGLYQEAMKRVKRNKRDICASPFITMSVKYNGEICLCPHDFNNRWVVGNIFKDSLEKVWNGKKAQEFRQALIENDKKFFKENKHHCDKCNIPYLEENSLKGYREYTPIRVARQIRTFHFSRNDV